MAKPSVLLEVLGHVLGHLSQLWPDLGVVRDV